MTRRPAPHNGRLPSNPVRTFSAESYSTSATKTVATLRKNNAQEIRVRVAERAGYRLVDLRIYSMRFLGDGEPRPTSAGICIVMERVPELIRALQVALEAVR